MVIVFKSNVSLVSCSGVDADAKDEEADDSEDFDGCEPEFHFAVKGYGEEVDGCDDDPEDSDEDSHVEIWSPVLDD